MVQDYHRKLFLVMVTAAILSCKIPTIEEPSKLKEEEPDITTYTNPPKILSTTPASGSTDVNPSTTSLTVVFDQDMLQVISYSTNHQFNRTAEWLDKRTLRINFPEGLSPGYTYQITFNPTGHVSMANTSGLLLAENTTISFTTSGN